MRLMRPRAAMPSVVLSLWIVAALGGCRDHAPASSGPVSPEPTESKTALGPPSPTSVAPPSPDAGAFVPERVSTESKAMGTHLAFTAYSTPAVDATKARRLFDDAIAEIGRIEALMTTWRPDSEISRINAAAGKSPVNVGAETFAVIKEALHTSEISDGTFDITFEALHGLWKFDEDLDPHPPTDAQLKARLPLVGYKHVKLDEGARSVFLDREGVKISLGGIAKGYAVDRASKVLLEGGLSSFFVQAGGDLYTHGVKPDGREWQAGIRDPRGKEGSFFAMLPVTDHAFSTAGDYERSYVVGGKRYHHILDPRTGRPATASRSVTIWATSALLADAIDDAVFILGPEKGLRLVESLDGVGAVIVDAANDIHVSKRLHGKLAIVAVPSDGP
jgi:FAD:protein FMN transferase